MTMNLTSGTIPPPFDLVTSMRSANSQLPSLGKTDFMVFLDVVSCLTDDVSRGG